MLTMMFRWRQTKTCTERANPKCQRQTTTCTDWKPWWLLPPAKIRLHALIDFLGRADDIRSYRPSVLTSPRTTKRGWQPYTSTVTKTTCDTALSTFIIHVHTLDTHYYDFSLPRESLGRSEMKEEKEASRLEREYIGGGETHILPCLRFFTTCTRHQAKAQRSRRFAGRLRTHEVGRAVRLSFGILAFFGAGKVGGREKDVSFQRFLFFFRE